MTPQKYGPRISVCIATLNEGPDLEATIALAFASRYKPHDIIVCDDNSESDPSPRLKSWLDRPDFTYLRNNMRQGSGPTKSRAMKHAAGDVIVILDSHMRPHFDWLNQIASAHLAHPNALLCTESIGFDQPHQGQFYGRGAWFDPSNPLKHGAHTVQWMPHNKIAKGKYPRIAAMHGGCYIFPRYQLDRIGGYAPLLRGWGYEEEWIAIRAAAYGIETRLISGCPIPHQYRRSLHRRPAHPEGRPQGWEPIYNRHMVAIAAFGIQKWIKIYRQNIINGTEHRMRVHVQEELDANKQVAQEFRSKFSRDTINAAEWMRRLNMTHPDPVAPDEHCLHDQAQAGSEPTQAVQVSADPSIALKLAEANERPPVGAGNPHHDIQN